MIKLPLLSGIMMSLALVSTSNLAGSLTVTNDFVSGTPAVAADVNQNFTDVETAVNDNDTRITTNATGVATNVTTITTNAGNITANDTDIATNASGITTNATNITTNTGNITTNSAGISTNVGTISTNSGTITTNSTSIGNNTTNIGTNSTNIGNNTTSIGTNSTNIGTNTTNIGTNSTAITALQVNSFTCAGIDGTDIMVRVGSICVDKYEASVWNTSDGSGLQYGATSDNYPCVDTGSDCTNVDDGVTATDIFARSQASVTPSTTITWFQAQQACANNGKRLLTNAEWQMAVAATVDPGPNDGSANASCNTGTGGGDAVRVTGGGTSCTSKWAVEDLIGNANEWVADWIHGNGAVGTFVPNPNATFASATYGDDLIVGTNTAVNSTNTMPAAILRGGAFNDQGGAGAFYIRADFAPDFVGNTRIGFRCAR